MKWHIIGSAIAVCVVWGGFYDFALDSLQPMDWLMLGFASALGSAIVSILKAEGR